MGKFSALESDRRVGRKAMVLESSQWYRWRRTRLTEGSVNPRYPRFNPSYIRHSVRLSAVNSAENMAELASDVASFVSLPPSSLLAVFPAVFICDQGGCGTRGGFEAKNRAVMGKNESTFSKDFLFLPLFFFSFSLSCFAFDLTRYLVS